MIRAWQLWALALAIALQLLVLVGQLLVANYPRWSGQEVLLEVEPVDPRSLFRGNYARLNYPIGRVSQPAEASDWREHEVVYVTLRPDEQGVMRAFSVQREPPEQGVFIRGRTQHVWRGRGELRVHYGIEAYFLPREKALAMEAELRRSGALARVMLAPNGKAALLEVIPPKPTSSAENDA